MITTFAIPNQPCSFEQITKAMVEIGSSQTLRCVEGHWFRDSHPHPCLTMLDSSQNGLVFERATVNSEVIFDGKRFRIVDGTDAAVLILEDVDGNSKRVFPWEVKLVKQWAVTVEQVKTTSRQVIVEGLTEKEAKKAAEKLAKENPVLFLRSANVDLDISERASALEAKLL